MHGFRNECATRMVALGVMSTTAASSSFSHTESHPHPWFFRTASFQRSYLADGSMIRRLVIAMKEYPQSSSLPGAMVSNLSLRSRVACEQLAWSKNEDKFPIYSAEHVREHVKGETNVIWVTHGKGVYDVTDFVKHHPGMKILLEANGGPLEPMWSLYRVHFNDSVQRKLETMRVGTLRKKDRISYTDIDDPYADDPIRDPNLLVLQERPFDAETPLHRLKKKKYVPNDLFYVRNHFPVPLIDREDHAVEVTIPVECVKSSASAHAGASESFTMEELDSFPQHEVDSFLCCAGNRSREITKSRMDSAGGQVGNAKWEGVRLLDIFRQIGFDEEKLRKDPTGWNVHLEGSDSYSMSIPLYLVLEEDRNVLLATKMNGEDLPRDHGYPVRTIVPGVAGARSVKWLSRISLSREESESPWHQRIYRYRPNVYGDEDCDETDANYEACVEWPLNSMILSPKCGEQVVVDQGSVIFRGVALPSRGRQIKKIEISFDKQTWIPCNFEPETLPEGAKQWSWTPWWVELTEQMLREAAEDRSSGQGKNRGTLNEVKMCCRATDDSEDRQERAKPLDHRGLMYNSYHFVTANIRRAESVHNQ